MIDNNIPNGNVKGAGDTATQGSKKLTVEKIYQKKSQLEHILLRPDTYIGSVEPVTEQQFIYDEEKKQMIKKEVTYVPGLYKIFDEILVNAADNKQRDSSMNQIKIDIKVEDNVISIYNNGQGIPVVKHKEEKMYVPTMIFGHLLTSSNYDDEEQKVTGGRNGYGAKLCNIFSTKFTVETASSEYAKAFRQTWENNMLKAGPEKIQDYMGKDYTKITFSPDLSKFKMSELNQDIVDLMTRRAFDVAASTGVNVFLNGKKLSVHSFKDYVNLFIPKDEEHTPKVVYEKVSDRWEVALTLSETGFQQMSFVNSIATTKGGRHVDHVTDAIVKYTVEKASKKHKGTAIKPFQVKNHMWLFINCLIINPTFDSQTKENMTTMFKSFGSKCQLSDTFFKNVEKNLGLIEAVVTWAKFKDEAKMAKTGGKKLMKLKVKKLEDANHAGSKYSMDCTLILTEGDSAKTLAVSGLGVVGRDKYGVFPLRGKLLNVREASSKQIMENKEINEVIKILGLQYKKKYESMDDLKSLRYGKLMIMTDQDQDGSHIKGLLINFIHHNWPSLLKLPFLEEFITPIVKASKGKEEISFFSLPEFEEWKKEKSNWHTYKIKYYKGLGTSTSKEAREYFSDMHRHRIRFKYSGPSDDTNITMAFSKKCVEQRKEWLTQWMESVKQRREMGLPEDYLYEKNTTTVNYSDFVNKELVLFSNSDNERSIPSVMDGMKPGQRKVLYTCLKRNDKKEIKVAQLAGSVAEQSAYHHGEVSLMSTIVNLAQNFVGSNNINILQPIGQFGTRLQGGKDQASPRYIFTMLSPLAKYIYHPDDEPLLTHQYDDNLKIEPVYYVPVIPMVLINGADGIGTGWSTKIPNFNPREIIKSIQKMISGEEPEPIIPWYKNFRGTIEPYGGSRYATFGELATLSEDTVEITELPVGVWTENYKNNVLDVMCGDGKAPGSILSFSDYNTDTTVRFVVQLTREKLSKAEDEGLHKFFKLQNTMSTSSMVAFDADGCLRKYETATEILKEHFRVRLEYYGKRKNYLEGMLQAESRKLSNQARFILEKCNGQLTIENKKRIAMVQELHKKGYDPDPVRAWKLLQDKDGTLAEESENLDQDEVSGPEESETESKHKYDYLLGMPMWSLTLEKKNELLKKRDEKLQEYETIKKKTPESIWCEDLDALLAKLDEVEEKERKDAVLAPVKSKKPVGKGPRSQPLETKPSLHGLRITPKFDSEMLKKLEKIEKPKVKRVKKADATGEDKDEFDDLIDKPTKSLKDRLGNSPEEIEKKLQAKRKNLKQTKIGFKKDSPRKKRKSSFSGSESGSDADDGDNDAFTTPPERSSSRRAAASKVKYHFSDESEAEWDDDDDDNATASKPVAAAKPSAPAEDKFEDTIDVSGTDSEFEPENTEPRNSGGPDAMFDSLLAAETTDVTEKAKLANDTVPKKKAPAKRAPAAKKTAPKRPKRKDDSASDSASDGEFAEKIPKRGRKKADSDEDFDVNMVVEPKSTSRKRTTTPKYTVDSDDDFDDFD